MKCSDSALPTDARLFDEPAATISAIIPLDDDPNLRTIHVDGNPAGVVRAVDVDQLGLSADMPWTDALANDVRYRASLVDARQRALRLLGRRGYSSAQLRKKLEPHLSPDVAAAAVAELVDDGWIDDRAVAQDIVDTILNRSPAGADLLREKLQHAGIEDLIVDDVIATTIQSDEQFERIVAYIMKQARIATGDTSKLARRLAQRLGRRGLDDELIMRSMEAAGLEISAGASDD